MLVLERLKERISTFLVELLPSLASTQVTTLTPEPGPVSGDTNDVYSSNYSTLTWLLLATMLLAVRDNVHSRLG